MKAPLRTPSSTDGLGFATAIRERTSISSGRSDDGSQLACPLSVAEYARTVAESLIKKDLRKVLECPYVRRRCKATTSRGIAIVEQGDRSALLLRRRVNTIVDVRTEQVSLTLRTRAESVGLKHTRQPHYCLDAQVGMPRRPSSASVLFAAVTVGGSQLLSRAAHSRKLIQNRIADLSVPVRCRNQPVGTRHSRDPGADAQSDLILLNGCGRISVSGARPFNTCPSPGARGVRRRPRFRLVLKERDWRFPTVVARLALPTAASRGAVCSGRRPP